MSDINVVLLPNGRQVFLGPNGETLAGGQVFFYVSGTEVFKDTWQDAEQTVANVNPVPLDGAGSASIWGSGLYRQVVVAANGTQIWDQETYGAVPQGGTSGGFGAQTAVPSAATVDLGLITTHNALVTGGVTIGSFGASAAISAPIYYVEVDTGLTLTNSAAFVVPGGKDRALLAGDAMLVEYHGAGNWKVIAIWPAKGLNEGFGPQVALATAVGVVDLGTINTNNVLLTGAVGPISGFGASASLNRPIYAVQFSGSLTLTNSAGLALLGGADLLVKANDTALFEYLGGGSWQMLSFNRAAGLGIPPNIQRLYLATANGAFDFTLPDTVTPATRIRFRLCAPGGGGGGTDAANGGGGGGGGSGGCFVGVAFGFVGGRHITGTVSSPGGTGGAGAVGSAGPGVTKFTYNAVDVVLCNPGTGGGKNGGGAASAGGTTVTNFAGLGLEEVLYSGGKSGTPGNYSASSVNFAGGGGQLVPFGSAGFPIGGLSGAGGVNGNDATGYGAGGGGATIDATGRGGNGAGGMFEMEILG